MADTRDTAERALADTLKAVTREVLYPGDANGERWRTATASKLLDAILSDPAARRALHEATREDDEYAVIVRRDERHFDELWQLLNASQRLSDAISNQVAIGQDGLFPANQEFDAHAEYLAALKALRELLAAHLKTERPISTPSPDDATGLRAAQELLNSLGIAGPNIIHAEQGMFPDGKNSVDDTWDGPGTCVCRREWPCEALRLDGLIRAALAASENKR